MNVISILIGICGFVLMSIGLIPLLGMLQWLVMGGAIIGILFGALSKGNKAGLYINVAVLVVAVIRTMMGGGVI